MSQTIKLKRTTTADNPPAMLAEGELAVGMNDAPLPKIYVGTPGGVKEINLGAYLPLVGGTLSGPGNLIVDGMVRVQSQVRVSNQPSDGPAATANAYIQSTRSPDDSALNLITTNANINLRARATSYAELAMHTMTSGLNLATSGIGDNGELRLTTSTSQCLLAAGPVGASLSSSSYGYEVSHNTTAVATNSVWKSPIAYAQLGLDANGYARLYLSKGAGQPAALVGAMGLAPQVDAQPGLVRWIVSLGDGTAETGGNVGSNFVIGRFNDAGTTMGLPLVIARNTGNVTLAGNVDANQFTSRSHQGVYVDGAVNAGGYWQAVPWFAAPQGYPLFMEAMHAPGSWARIRINVDPHIFDFHQNGSASKAEAGQWNAHSDVRIKSEINDYVCGLTELQKVRPRTFVFKGNDTDGVPKQSTVPYRESIHWAFATEKKKIIGLIAQEVEGILPELVTRSHGYIDGKLVNDMRDIDPSALMYVLVNAVKELANHVEKLKTQVDSLKVRRG